MIICFPPPLIKGVLPSWDMREEASRHKGRCPKESQADIKYHQQTAESSLQRTPRVLETTEQDHHFSSHLAILCFHWSL